MANSPKRILFVASECLPYAKAGGLADVVSALAKELSRRGHDVRVLMPLYGSIDRAAHGLQPFTSLCVHTGTGEVWTGIRRASLDGRVPVYFLEHDGMFGRAGVYGEGREYADNPWRFAVLCRAALQLSIDLDFAPDVMHLHDWPTAPVAAFLKDLAPGQEVLRRTASVLTIHNVEYQGKFGPESLGWLGLPPGGFHPDRFEDFGGINLLKGGIAYADAITTVSPTHAREMTGEPGGHGLSGPLARRVAVTTGILNGVDEDVWNPETDVLLPARYGLQRMRGKLTCKEALQARFGLDPRPDVPLFGIVSRFAAQKGFDLLREALPTLLESGTIQLALIGSGDRMIEAFFRGLAERHPRSAGAAFGYSEEVAHLVEAGADFFLMPSLYEPCGLNQMYSMRYGTLPIVRATGGLADTVVDHDPRTGAGTGFVFVEPTPGAAAEAIHRAVHAWYWQPAQVARMRRAAMALRFPWRESACRYEEVYEHALDARRGRPRESVREASTGRGGATVGLPGNPLRGH